MRSYRDVLLGENGMRDDGSSEKMKERTELVISGREIASRSILAKVAAIG